MRSSEDKQEREGWNELLRGPAPTWTAIGGFLGLYRQALREKGGNPRFWGLPVSGCSKLNTSELGHPAERPNKAAMC